MIKVSHLKKIYGSKTAIDDISFSVEKNQVCGFLGPNGAGKSTTMNIITGCLSSTDGNVSIDGYDIFKEPFKAKAQIGYLPEQPPLYVDMTPREYLTFVAEAKKIKKSAITAVVDSVMKKTTLLKAQNKLIKNLSKGYRQRVGIAGAILGNPPVVILDEPTVGLDPKQIIEIRNLIKTLGKTHTVLLSSHILAEVNEVCDRIIIISDGRLIADATPKTLMNQFAYDTKLNVTVRTDVNTAKRILSDIACCNTKNTLNVSFNSIGEISSFSITLKNEDNSLLGYDIRDNIFKAFCKENISILEMSLKKATLEQIFIKLTSEYTVNDNSSIRNNEDSKNSSNKNKFKEVTDEINF